MTLHCEKYTYIYGEIFMPDILHFVYEFMNARHYVSEEKWNTCSGMKASKSFTEKKKACLNSEFNNSSKAILIHYENSSQ